MNQVQAVIELIREARKEKGTVTGYKRVRRALRALGLNEDDQITVLIHLEYYHPDRIPYIWLAEKL